MLRYHIRYANAFGDARKGSKHAKEEGRRTQRREKNAKGKEGYHQERSTNRTRAEIDREQAARLSVLLIPPAYSRFTVVATSDTSASPGLI
jgi:hypothetical protein